MAMGETTSSERGEDGGLPPGFFRLGIITTAGNPERRREVEARLREREEGGDK